MPCDFAALRADVAQRDPYEVQADQFLPFDVEKLLSKLLHHELMFAVRLEIMRQELVQCPGFST